MLTYLLTNLLTHHQVGYGLSADAHHMTSSSGHGAARAMRSALTDAACLPSDITYINAHATSTPTGDAAELSAIAEVFGGIDARTRGGRKEGEEAVFVSSTKGALGHQVCVCIYV